MSDQRGEAHLGTMTNHGLQMGPLIAYQGREGCQSGVCRSIQNEAGEWICVGWHCAFCHEPSSYQGHVDCHPDQAP